MRLQMPDGGGRSSTLPSRLFLAHGTDSTFTQSSHGVPMPLLPLPPPITATQRKKTYYCHQSTVSPPFSQQKRPTRTGPEIRPLMDACLLSRYSERTLRGAPLRMDRTVTTPANHPPSGVILVRSSVCLFVSRTL